MLMRRLYWYKRSVHAANGRDKLILLRHCCRCKLESAIEALEGGARENNKLKMLVNRYRSNPKNYEIARFVMFNSSHELACVFNIKIPIQGLH